MYKSFVFFDLDDHVLFHRNDAEEAEWTHQDLSLTAMFPFVKEKEIDRGMRIGFEDSFGRFQLFEIRQVKDTEPEHAQAITAEHIAISELTDIHLVKYKPTEAVTAQTAVTALLTGTGWSIGTCTSTASHKPDIEMTSVWAALTDVRDMMGLRLEPYVTVSETAITGRYIDVVDNVGVWRGVRLSINKNIDQIGVTYEDTSLVTAVYGYGAALDDEYTPPPRPTSGESGSGSGGSGSSGSGDTQLSNDRPGAGSGSESGTSGDSSTDYGAEYVTIKNVVWTQTAEHPAKPAGQMYLEDPEATALYGRNGQPRFGFYSNSDVDDPDELIGLCWEALQRQNKPKVTVDCTVSDLYSLGYEGEQIQIGDTVKIEIEPIGAELEIMCICLTEDLLNQANTRVTIGRFIKDIVYITKEEDRAAGGGGGGGGGGGANEDKIEQEKSVYTKFDRTDEYILLQAVSIQKVEGALNTAYSEIYMNAQEIALEVTRATGAEATLSSRISLNADNITLEVTRATQAESQIQLTLDGINISSSGDITIKGSTIHMSDYVLMSTLQADYATITQLTATNTLISELRAGQADFSLVSASDVDCDSLSAGALTVDSINLNGTSVAPNVVHSFGQASPSGGQISIPVNMLDGSSGTAITFNIADTQYYQQGVSAADLAGYNRGVGEFHHATVYKANVNGGIYLTRYGNAQLYTWDGDPNHTPTAVGNARYWYYNTLVDVSTGTYAPYTTDTSTYYTRS
jgi:hypothetical protein